MNAQELEAAREAIISELVRTIKLLKGNAIQNPWHLQEIAIDSGKLHNKVIAATFQ